MQDVLFAESAIVNAPVGNDKPGPRAAVASVVIIGGGPAGIRMAQELTRRGIDCTLINAERWLPYNRVKLTPLLCGDSQIGQVMQSLKFSGDGKATLYSNQSVVDIDRDARFVMTSTGRRVPYRKLVFATGSRAHVPPIPGIALSGVYRFRNFDDVEALVARSFRSRRTVVIGGGLLGLEAARGMAARGVETWIVEHEQYLMARQLDERAGEMLCDKVCALGLNVRTGVAVKSIVGDARVEAIELSTGERIDCDTIIVCTGIRANRELARDVGLAVGRGITVSDTMQTQDPDIYAVGECAEIGGFTCGLVGPAFEQAVVAARHIAGEPGRYEGSVPSTKLKIVGVDVFSMGDIEQLAQRRDLHTLTFEDADHYRRLVVRRGRIVGAISIGAWDETNRLQEAVRNRTWLYPWQSIRFLRSGKIFGDDGAGGVREWPSAATVCNCTGVNRGQIGEAISLGAANLEDVRRDTGASTVCGSCAVLISELLDTPPPREPAKGARPLAVLGAVALVLGLAVVLSPIWPLASKIQFRGLPEALWLDGFWKQVSGFTLLGLSVAAAVLSLRKRINWLRFGDFAIWRIVHLVIGAIAIAALVVHTGFRLGTNLNFWLMTSFLALSLAGAAAGLVTAAEHRIFAWPQPAARTRSISFWFHLIAFWPIPVLLGFHIVSVYYF
jgi:NAD(P)H-nitrite reductase large subunit